MSYGETKQPRSSIGEPEPDISHLLRWVDELVLRDEPLLALEALKILPSRLRDSVPPEIISVRNLILSKLVTPSDTIGEDFVPPMEELKGDEILDSLRGRLVLESVLKANRRGSFPTVIEFAPGNYWLPIGLKRKCWFKYRPVYVDTVAYEKFQRMHGELIDPSPSDEIFVAHEIIEHLWDPRELVKEQLSKAPRAEVIHLSTPEYNYFHNREWKDGPALLHLRAYTPKEFLNFAETNWPDFFWQMYPGQPMSIVGIRQGFEHKWIG